jgi:hypothetical protein
MELPTGPAHDILRNSAVPDIFDRLGELTPRELQAAILEDSARRAGSLAAADVIRQYEDSGLTEPCELDQREILRFSAFVAHNVPAHFDMVELSPVTTFGVNAALAGISQRNILTASRGTEVLADGVTALTLAAAQQRRANPRVVEPIHLGTLQRELRTQRHEQPGFTAHFHALSLVSTERTRDSDAFSAQTFTDHVATYLDIIEQSSATGYQVGDTKVALSNIRIAELLVKNLGLNREEIMRHTQTPGFNLFDACSIPLPKAVAIDELEAVAESLPYELAFLKRPLLHTSRLFTPLIARVAAEHGGRAQVYYDLSRHAGIGYYQNACVKISAANAAGEYYPLVDIGSNDWLAKVTNNKDDRLITGGMGTELLMKQFKA